MSDTINLFTALLGLVASLIALKSISNEKKSSSGDKKQMDSLEGFKKTFNVVGSIVLVMALYFGYMILMMALPSLMSSAQNIGKPKKEDIIQSIQYEKIETLNEIGFYSAKTMYSNTSKDNQLDVIMENALKDKEYELVIQILNSYYSNTRKDKAIDKAIDYFIPNEAYLYALMASEIYYSNTKKDDKKNKIINSINTKLQRERSQDVSDKIIEEK